MDTTGKIAQVWDLVRSAPVNSRQKVQEDAWDLRKSMFVEFSTIQLHLEVRASANASAAVRFVEALEQAVPGRAGDRGHPGTR